MATSLNAVDLPPQATEALNDTRSKDRPYNLACLICSKLEAMKALKLGAAAAFVGTAAAQGQITNDTYFYGQSEPVYPSPEAQGLQGWEAAVQNAKAFVAQLTIEEKTNLTGGYAAENGCSGNIYPIERLGFPGLCVTDAGNGVRAAEFVNGYASGVHVGASWNKALTLTRGTDMGAEFRAKGVTHQLGPGKSVGALS